MKGFVGRLAAMVGGNAVISKDRSRVADRPRTVENTGRAPQKALPTAKKVSKGKAFALNRPKGGKSGNIIPMDENDFNDF
jgi:hypothetical protein